MPPSPPQLPNSQTQKNVNMKNTVIFDMDGTVLDTLADLTAALGFALQKNGMPVRRTEEVRGFVGNGIRKLIERGADATAPYAGVRRAIAALRRAGYRTAVVSNKADYAVQKLVRDYFPGDFDFAVGEKAGVARKPAPDMVYAALEALGAKKEDAVYVGDSEVDLQTAENAGLPCVSVTWGFKDPDFLLAHGAKTLIGDPALLPETIGLL